MTVACQLHIRVGFPLLDLRSPLPQAVQWIIGENISPKEAIYSACCSRSSKAEELALWGHSTASSLSNLHASEEGTGSISTSRLHLPSILVAAGRQRGRRTKSPLVANTLLFSTARYNSLTILFRTCSRVKMPSARTLQSAWGILGSWRTMSLGDSRSGFNSSGEKGENSLILTLLFLATNLNDSVKLGLNSHILADFCIYIWKQG